MRSVIAASWGRSRRAGVQPEASAGCTPYGLGSGTLADHSQESGPEPAVPGAARATPAREAPHLLIVTDPAGHLPWVEGDRTTSAISPSSSHFGAERRSPRYRGSLLPRTTSVCARPGQRDGRSARIAIARRIGPSASFGPRDAWSDRTRQQAAEPKKRQCSARGGRYLALWNATSYADRRGNGCPLLRRCSHLAPATGRSAPPLARFTPTASRRARRLDRTAAAGARGQPPPPSARQLLRANRGGANEGGRSPLWGRPACPRQGQSRCRPRPPRVPAPRLGYVD
jgi:hypothetical protein